LPATSADYLVSFWTEDALATSRSRLRLLPLLIAFLAAAAATSAGVTHGAAPAMPQPPPRPEPKLLALPRGRWTQHVLANGEVHVYPVDLHAGQFLRAEFDQRGVDLAVDVRAPDSRLLFRVDSTHGAKGVEIVNLVAATSGRFRLEVKPHPSPGPAGSYRARLVRLDLPDDEDRRRAEAELVFYRARAADKRGDGARTVAQYRRAASLFRQLDDPDHEAAALLYLGMQLRRGHDAGALDALQAACNAAAAAGSLNDLATARNEIGLCYLGANDFDKARDSYLAALQIYKQIDRPQAQAVALQNLGEIEQVLGRPWNALDFFLAARDIQVHLPVRDLEREIQTLTFLAWAYHSLHETERAFETYYRILANSNKIHDDRFKMIALNQLGDLWREQGQPEKALAYLYRASDLAVQLRAPRDLGSVYNNLGICLRALGRSRDAESAFGESLIAYRSPHQRREEAWAWLNLGWSSLWSHHPGEAKIRFRRAHTLGVEAHSPQVEAQAYFGLAEAAEQLNDLTEAQRLGEESVATVESQRSAMVRPDLQMRFLAANETVYDLLIRVLLKRHAQQPDAGFERQALAMSEQFSGRGLLDILRERSPAQSDERRALFERRRSLSAEITRRGALLSRYGPPPGQDSIGQLGLPALNAELHDVEAKLAASRPAEPSAPISTSSTVDANRLATLDPSTLVLEYHIARAHSAVWVIASQGPIQVVPLDGGAVLEPAILAVLDDFATGPLDRERRAAAEAHAFELSRRILGPVASLLGDSNLVIAANGALQSLPFAALPDPMDRERHLDERHVISYTPSLAVRAELQRRGAAVPPRPLSALVIADPVFDASDPRLALHRPADRDARQQGQFLSSLGSSRDEADALAQLLPDHAIEKLDFDAVPEAITGGAAAAVSFLHIGAHALTDPGSQEPSVLVLSRYAADGTRRDGYLPGEEVEKLHLSADLVFLNACDTAHGPRIAGEFMVGLPKAFLAAGARRVVVTLWKIDDDAAAELSKVFYQGIVLRHLSPEQALRAAQAALRRQAKWADPYYWAGFILVGG
jgi:CHAT domain-containing protein/tetratricopeptide (TPR) repeat protein